MEASKKEVSVLVIGAGLVGAMIAYKLANAGKRVAVLDAHKVAQGATQRAIGLATAFLSKEHIADTAHGAEALTSLALQLKVAARACRVLHLASKPADTEELLATFKSLSGGRPRLAWESRLGPIPDGFSGGIVTYNSILFDIAALTAQLLQHPNIVVQEDAEVQALEWHQGSLTALAHGYTVRADFIVLAANAYSGMLSPYLADAVQVVHGVTWLSQPLDRQSALLERVMHSVPMPLIIDRAHFLVAQTLDWRLRINAWHWNNHVDYNPIDDVQGFLRANLPDLLEYTEEWRTGVTTVTRDGAPLVGLLPGGRPVLYAIGAGMYGPAWAPVIAERIAHLLEA